MMTEPLRIFIGFDPRQPISYNVLSHSLIKRASRPITIAPLKLETLPIKRKGLTPFTFSRLLVPYLCGYQGKALYMDADILAQDDICKLFDEAQGEHDIWVSKNPIRFEWSSVTLFDCAKCEILTESFIESNPSPLDLAWAKSIGSLDPSWNWLCGYDAPNPEAKLRHYTAGVPCWPETMGCESADVWMKEAKESMSAVSWEQLMGKSVHSKIVYERLMRNKALRNGSDANEPAPN